MTIYQRPNAGIIIAAVGLLLSWPLGGVAENITFWWGIIAFIIWSLGEIITGINGVRKFFGWCGLALSVLILNWRV